MKLTGQPRADVAETAEVCFTTWPHPIPGKGTLITVTQYGEERDFLVVSASEDPPYSLRLEMGPA